MPGRRRVYQRDELMRIAYWTSPVKLDFPILSLLSTSDGPIRHFPERPATPPPRKLKDPHACPSADPWWDEPVEDDAGGTLNARDDFGHPEAFASNDFNHTEAYAGNGFDHPEPLASNRSDKNKLWWSVTDNRPVSSPSKYHQQSGVESEIREAKKVLSAHAGSGGDAFDALLLARFGQRCNVDVKHATKPASKHDSTLEWVLKTQTAAKISGTPSSADVVSNGSAYSGHTPRDSSNDDGFIAVPKPEILRTGSPLSISYTAGEEAPATKTSATDTPTQEATVEDGSKENRSEGQQCEGCGREWGYILSCLEGLRFESDGKVQLHAPLPVHDDLDGLDFS